jgi:hypothetical protein
MGRQNALHKENSGFAAPTLGRHIQILFSIRNPYINRFTNHFSIHSQPSYPQKVVLHSITARFVRLQITDATELTQDMRVKKQLKQVHKSKIIS